MEEGVLRAMRAAKSGDPMCDIKAMRAAKSGGLM